MELKEKYLTVYTGEVLFGDQRVFRLEKQNRFIDINNLDKYTVKQLISIFGSKIGNANKHHYISAIIKKRSAEILKENREYRLNQLGI